MLPLTRSKQKWLQRNLCERLLCFGDQNFRKTLIDQINAVTSHQIAAAMRWIVRAGNAMSVT